MAKRKKKHEPEMLIVSFCDIVTITTAAMFFAMLVTVTEAVKVPIFKPTPRATPTDKQPCFFECRNDEVFFVDKASLDDQVTKLLNTLAPGVKGGDLGQFLKAIQGQEVGNEYYKVNASYLLAAVMALDARTNVHGEAAENLETPGCKFQKTLAQLNPKVQYCVFLVRDDSFKAFRKARIAVDKLSFETGWELLGVTEPIKFGAGGTQILSN